MLIWKELRKERDELLIMNRKLMERIRKDVAQKIHTFDMMLEELEWTENQRRYLEVMKIITLSTLEEDKLLLRGEDTTATKFVTMLRDALD